MKTAQTAQNGGSENGNTKEPPRYRNWTGTWFGDLDKGIAQIKGTFKHWTIGREICPTTKREHLQWFGSTANGHTVKAMRKKWEPSHIEKANNPKSANAYCMKEFNYETNINPSHKMKVIGVHKLYDWQNKVIEIIKKKEERKINWFWEPKGNAGKTSFVRDLAIMGRTLVVGGRKQDIFYAVKEFSNSIDTIVIDIPRSETNSVNYAAIESLLGGIFFSPKYESGMFIFEPPVVIIMANFPPDTDDDMMSEDRWNVIRI